jgi:uncharacterized membrane protein
MKLIDIPTSNKFPQVTSSNRDLNVKNSERVVSVTAGLLILLDAITRIKTVRGALELIAGSTLVYRGATGHCRLYQALNINTASNSGASEIMAQKNSVLVKETFTINRPSEEVYLFWRNFENLARFMRHLESITVLSNTRSRWRAWGPASALLEWESEITADIPSKQISWHSIEGSDIANAGSVTFLPGPIGVCTEITVHLKYAPPLGELGEKLTKLFGKSAEQQIREDLRRFKQLLETGEIATTEGQPTGPR